jgi:hypothetical protein
MNSIKLEIPFNSHNVDLVKTLLSKVTNVKEGHDLEVIGSEILDSPAKKTPAARPSRAKAKPEPKKVEEDLDEEDFPEEDETEEDLDDEEEITEDTLRELSAKKIGKHKDAIIAQLAKYKVKGWANLDAKHYQAMHDFMTKLK